MAPATRRNAFCDLLHLIKMSLDDVLIICNFHASLHSGGKGSRKVQKSSMVRKIGLLYQPPPVQEDTQAVRLKYQ